jgi:dienelactone hydrolase
MSYPNQQFPSQYYPPPPQQRSGGSKTVWIVLAVLGGGALVLGLACCGGIMWIATPPTASAAAKVPFSVAEVPVPPFPERGPLEEFEPGVMWRTIALSDTDGYYDTPGHGGTMFLYLPPGEHAPGSLPCILICGAGSNLLSGMMLGEGDQPEHTPYVHAGFAVLAYELDGPSTGEGDDELKRAYEAFKASRAGIVNGRNALEYVLARVPEVNPKKIYAAGHSSAASHALLFAEHEPRLAGVVAYAPGVNLPKRFGGALRLFSMIMPGAVDFITQVDPATHAARLKCPVFLFHAEDDSNCPVEDTRAFADQLKQHGANVTLKTVPTGDHYDSMIEEGIPAGIEWLRQRP